MEVVAYTDGDAGEWDALAGGAPMATFLHTRRFLGYHGDRFADASLLIKQDGRLVGLFPAAVDPADGGSVLSHPGITYGGVVHAGALRGEAMLAALTGISDFYRARGFGRLRYKVVPHIYHRRPSADDLYALSRLGAVRYRCDLSCAVDLLNRPAESSRRRRSLKKAQRSGVEVREGAAFAARLWEILEDNLGRKYGSKPVHSLGEITHLYSLFPSEIRFVVAALGDRVVAGVVLFSSATVTHAQYIASSVEGYEVCALDAVFHHCVGEAGRRGARFFDFGTSNEREGRHLNASLYQFKAEFGGGGVAHEFYELPLGAEAGA